MGYGYGSVYQRARDGRWVASVELPRERGAPRRRKLFTATTEARAWARLDAWREDHTAPSFPGRAEHLARVHVRDGGGHTSAQWWALVRATKGICHYCGTKTDCTWTPPDHPRHLQKDHRTPLCRGGSDLIENIVVSCRSCNSDKDTMTEAEYAAWKDRGHVQA